VRVESDLEKEKKSSLRTRRGNVVYMVNKATAQRRGRAEPLIAACPLRVQKGKSEWRQQIVPQRQK